MSKMYYELYGAIEQKVAIVPLKISLAADASVVSFVGKGVVSVTKNGTGKYDVILKDNYNKLLSVSFASEAASATDIACQLDNEVVTAKTFSVVTYNTVSATDGSPAVNTIADTAVAQKVHVTLIVTKSSVA